MNEIPRCRVLEAKCYARHQYVLFLLITLMATLSIQSPIKSVAPNTFAHILSQIFRRLKIIKNCVCCTVKTARNPPQAIKTVKYLIRRNPLRKQQIMSSVIVMRKKSMPRT